MAEPQPYEGGEYVGDWHGKPHGRGVLRKPNGDVYKGKWLDGMKSGFGRETNNENEEYVGGWLNGQKHGMGKWKWPCGGYYEGQWANGKYDGFGTHSCANGTKYVGQFKNGKRHGKGQLTWNNGNVHEGYWDGGEQYGLGIAHFRCSGKKHGTGIYRGFWKNDSMHGLGVFVDTDGDRYVGRFEDHGRCDSGKEPGVDPNAVPMMRSTRSTNVKCQKFRREVLCKRCDSGKATSWPGVVRTDSHEVREYADGSKYVGQLKDGKRHGEGLCCWPCGGGYHGKWANDMYQGRGMFLCANGYFYSGQWKAGLKHGEGELVYENGNRHTGHWIDDKQHGAGTAKYVASGTSFSGLWKDDCPVGS